VTASFSLGLPCGRDTTYVRSIGLTQLSMKKNGFGPVVVCTPVSVLDVASPSALGKVLLTYHVGCGLSASLATCPSRGFMMTLHSCSTWPDFPSPPPRRGWQRSEHCSQSFALPITRQPIWVGTPGHHRARSGSSSPSAILLHRSYGVSQEYAYSPPGRNALKDGASTAVFPSPIEGSGTTWV